MQDPRIGLQMPGPPSPPAARRGPTTDARLIARADKKPKERTAKGLGYTSYQPQTNTLQAWKSPFGFAQDEPESYFVGKYNNQIGQPVNFYFTRESDPAEVDRIMSGLSQRTPRSLVSLFHPPAPGYSQHQMREEAEAQLEQLRFNAPQAPPRKATRAQRGKRGKGRGS